MALPLLDDTQPCAIVSPDATFIIGGQTLGFENQLRTEIIMYIGGTHDAYIGVILRFPRARGTAASFFKSNLSKSEDLAITIRWRLNTFNISGGSLDFAPQVKMLLPEQCEPDDFGILQVNLRPGERSLISGMGFPFQGKNVAIDGYVNSGYNIHGGCNLETIIGQTSFMVLTTAKILYGNEHHWDVNRYRNQMAFETRVARQDPVRYSFDDLNDAATVITQSIAQDNWWYAMDVQDVRKVKLPFLFLKDGDKPSAETDRFWAITRLSPAFVTRFKRSIGSLTNPNTELSIAFRLPPSSGAFGDNEKPDRDDLSWSAKVVPIKNVWSEEYRGDRPYEDGGYFVLEVHRPRDPTSPVYRIRNHPIRAFQRIKKQRHEEPIIETFLRLEKEAERENVYLDFFDGRVLSRRRVNATDDLFQPTVATRNVLPYHSSGPETDHSDSYNALKTTLQEFFIGRGYSHPIFHLPTIANGDDGDVGLIRMTRIVSLDGDISSEAADPTLQFDAAYANEVMSERSPSFRRYIKTVALQIIGVQGTRRKATEVLVSTTLLFLANPATNKVHASASSHNAVLDFALMLYEKGTEVVKALRNQDTCNMPRHIPLVVRGYNIKKEVGSFIRLVTRGEIEWELSTWSQPLSPCEWLLKLVDFDEFEIDLLDSPELFHLRHRFRNDRKFAGLRAFVKRDIPLHEVRDFVVSSGASHTASDNNRKEKNMTAQQERDERLRAEHWARELIKYLLVDIMSSADVLCTTTHMSRDAHYNDFRESAKAVVLTDAGSMSKAEAIVVWGPLFKPCAIGGDVGRRTRTFIEPNHVSDGKHANHYGPESQVSVLRHMMSSGNAMFEAK
ncbi:hypothetical protein CTA2_7481 [Colletotrichum tanaceti]|uniref:Uncharacterized protein n=1 Tax=Colletotrichum tanaceti TaxID=1306861 RepID=A0A4U6X733_9PEZI|nr:hypothetical protein CTA2_7481 [Colletotrichum tanaceti]TKW49247.1 hypothetical protein CTA1_9876 [Colletotrichum tanaceti]